MKIFSSDDFDLALIYRFIYENLWLQIRLLLYIIANGVKKHLLK